MKKVFLLVSIFLHVCFFPAQASATPEEATSDEKPLEKEVVGWIEKVHLSPGNITLDAKLDTGADNCSLNAENIKKFKRDGKRWVRFDIKNRIRESTTIELPILKKTRIKRVKGKSQIRPVVRLGLCLAGKFSEVDVNLADRSNFSYPLLVGRSFLSAHVILDPARTYMSEPDCKVDEK